MDRPAAHSHLHTCSQDEWGHAEPCQACGAGQEDGIVIVYEYPATSYSVRCRACGALGRTAWKDEPAGHWRAIACAIEYWNRYGAK
jgi:hypothetical protein